MKCSAENALALLGTILDSVEEQQASIRRTAWRVDWSSTKSHLALLKVLRTCECDTFASTFQDWLWSIYSP